MQQAQMIICACCAFYIKEAYNFSQYNLQVTTNEKKFIRFGNFTIFLPG